VNFLFLVSRQVTSRFASWTARSTTSYLALPVKEKLRLG